MAGHWALAFGLLGNIISFIVFLAPIPTFYQIYKKKTSEGFQSIPYVIALFSATLWIYYALLKENATLIITINTVGCFIETIYIVFYIIYATKNQRMHTAKLLVLLVVSGAGFICVCQFLVKASERVVVVGWICLIFSLCVFVAPLCIVRQVIKTKSVEHMPFLLSFFLTLSAVMWFFYGLFLKDKNIAIPNVLGFAFGIIQMVLYLMYKDSNKKKEEQKLPEVQKQITILEEHEIPQLREQIIEIVKCASLLNSDKNIPVVSCQQGAANNGGIPAAAVPAATMHHQREIQV